MSRGLMENAVLTAARIVAAYLPVGLPFALAWCFFLGNVALARWLENRDARLLPRVLRSAAFAGVVCLGIPAGGDVLAECLEHRDAFGVCFLGETVYERSWTSGLDLQVDSSGATIKVVGPDTCAALSATDLTERGWSATPHPHPDAFYRDVDGYPVEEALATPGNWYRYSHKYDDERLEVLDLARCRIVTDWYNG